MRITTSAAITSARRNTQKQAATVPRTSSENLREIGVGAGREGAEIIAVERRRVGNARIAEQ